MTNEEIVNHLKELRNSVLYTVTLLHQMDLIIKWQSEKDPTDEAGIRGQFFGMVSVCFYRVIVLECYKLIWDTEHQNLYEFLNQLSKFYDQASPSDGDGNIIDRDEYVQLIRDQKKELNQFKGVKNNIQELRNNLIAHSDSTYYLDKNKVGKDFPVTWKDLNDLLDVIKNIVRRQYSLISDADVDMSRIHAGTNARQYLERLRAMERFWKNDNLNNVRKIAFFSDEYDPKDIFMK
ncbi:MAG: hypothetical protein JJ892_11950 [Balneola sp.]|nr:hypothetical protein [Balneola sp.]MBO6651438.1 hypothetical protein [Balneola sp.]MBO6712525.1 hypothetical protein [Balneola sp.]MBO6800982.1 hypothetical protein [Balneola sp.]MBO6870654.1 hypothetical protein [Balneola sp.]